MTLALLALALAGPADDLRVAADPNRPQAEREAAFGRIAVPTATAEVLTLIDSAQVSEDQRWVLIRSLGHNPTDEARAALIGLLDDDAALNRMAAIGALADRKDPAVTGRIAARLTDKAILVRASAAEALGRLKDPDVLPDLGRALADPSAVYRGQSLWVRRRYVEAMGQIGTDAAVPYLSRALDDDDPAVVQAALASLERVAGFSYAEGRTEAEQIEAWRRWAGR